MLLRVLAAIAFAIAALIWFAQLSGISAAGLAALGLLFLTLADFKWGYFHRSP